MHFSALLKIGDYKEGYYIGVEVPEDDPEAEKPFYGPNVWPATGYFSVLMIASWYSLVHNTSCMDFIRFLCV